jgi:hypothetical protein
MWLMRRRAKSLHEIYSGFDPDHWHPNDGAVNIHSMLRPWFPTPQELAASQKAASPIEPASGGVGLRASASTLSLRSSSSMSSMSGALGMARCESHISIDAFHREEVNNLSDDDGDHSSDDTPVVHEPLFKKGRWYVYRVDKNHLAGTYWDSEAGDLYKSLFTMISTEYEREPMELHHHRHLHHHSHSPTPLKGGDVNTTAAHAG